ncbi:hypothetical protein DM860_005422 [Cuscuta australis]|uniref:Serine incorporator n=1 Tax=Cuscuta australis TaxID=267555 RepID=A0A328E0Y2_9ASTE|nr:hypothetical protein DM860_005422 [Cuscuta australis]
MHIGCGSSSSDDDDDVGKRYEKIKNGSWLGQFGDVCNPWMARYAYGLLFLLANLLAWAVRDYGSSFFKASKRLNECNGGKDCLGTDGVLRVSLGCCMFYLIMFASTIFIPKVNSWREKWHSGWWIPKIGMMGALLVFPFFLPIKFLSIYGLITYFGTGVFLVIQLISINGFINRVSEWCESKDRSCPVMMFETILHIFFIMVIIFFYIWFVPRRSCAINIFFITATLILHLLNTAVALFLTKANNVTSSSSSLTSGFMGLYLLFLCWTALKSEPGEKCILMGGSHTSKIDIVTIAFRREHEEHQDADDVPYNYGFFHFVFAVGTMYFALLLNGWNAGHPMRKFTIDVGWVGTWARIINELAAALVYMWLRFSDSKGGSRGGLTA